MKRWLPLLIAALWATTARAQEADPAPVVAAEPVPEAAQPIDGLDVPVPVETDTPSDSADTDSASEVEAPADTDPPLRAPIEPDPNYTDEGPEPPTVEDLRDELERTRAEAAEAAHREAAAQEALVKALEAPHPDPHTDPHTDAAHLDPGEAPPHHEPDTAAAEPPTAPPDTPQTTELWPRFFPFLPTLPYRGLRAAVVLLISTILCWLTARAIGSARDRLAPSGVLPSLLGVTQQGLRATALFFALGVIAAILPRNLEPALPWIVVAGALAIGWSARDVMPDFLAGVVLAAERRVLPGRWVSTTAANGMVEQVGFRVTWLIDATGRKVAVPNRVFLSGAVVTDRGTWPSVEVVIRVPHGQSPSLVHKSLEDAILISPWAAPVPPEMVREEQEPGTWRVRARVLEGRFADRFAGALREHVEETLTGTAPAPDAQPAD